MAHSWLAGTAFLLIFCSTLIGLNLFARLLAGGYTKRLWLVSAAFVFGIGIWSMHFVAMLAHAFPVRVMYHFSTVFLSMGIIVVMSYIALALCSYALSGPYTKLRYTASVIQTIGVCAMHYVGLLAMKTPAEMQFNPILAIVSILPLIPAFSFVFHPERISRACTRTSMTSALLVSTAISLIHYGNMPVVQMEHMHSAADTAVHDNNLILALTVIFVAAIIFVYSIVIMLIDNRLKQSEERLRQLNLMYSHTLNSVAEGIVRLDEQMNVLFWNSAAEKITGFSLEDVVGSPLSHTFRRSSPSDDSCLFQSVYETGRDKFAEETIYHKHGRPFPIEYHVTPMYTDERVVGAVINFTDISERKKSESMLRESEKLSLAGQLAAGIAHEIRNPLTSVKGFVQLMQGGLQKKEYLPIMISEINRMELIISELLMLAKPQNSQFKPYNLIKLLEHVVSLIESLAILHNVRICFERCELKYPILCDANQIKQVFINIMKNAIEAAQGGEVKIRTAQVGNKVVTSVIDNGCGIPAETLKHIGQPFFTTKEKGTGLGLMISNKIITSHGGTMEIKSMPGAGTTFAIALPLAVLSSSRSTVPVTAEVVV